MGAQAFLNEAKLRKVAEAATAGTDAVNSSVVDTQNGMDLTFFADIGTANAGNHIKLQEGDESDLSDAADLADTKVVAAADGDVVAVENFRPTKRYLRAVITRTASTTTGPIYCVQRGGRVLPIDNNVDDEIVSEIHASPAAGTA